MKTCGASPRIDAFADFDLRRVTHASERKEATKCLQANHERRAKFKLGRNASADRIKTTRDGRMTLG